MKTWAEMDARERDALADRLDRLATSGTLGGGMGLAVHEVTDLRQAAARLRERKMPDGWASQYSVDEYRAGRAHFFGVHLGVEHGSVPIHIGPTQGGGS